MQLEYGCPFRSRTGYSPLARFFSKRSRPASGPTEGPPHVSAHLDSAVLPLFAAVLGAFAACAVGVVMVARRGAAHEPSRGRMVRLELAWTLLTGAFVFALAGGSLSRQHASPVHVAVLGRDDTASAEDENGAKTEDADAASASDRDDSAAEGEIAEVPDSASPDAATGDPTSLPTDEQPAGANANVE